MNSCAASCCTCSPRGSCVFVISASWPTVAALLRCRSAFSYFLRRQAADRPRLFNPRCCERSLVLSSMCWPHGDHRTTHSRRNPTPLSTSSNHGRRMRELSTSRMSRVSQHPQPFCVLSHNKSALLPLQTHPLCANVPLPRRFLFPRLQFCSSAHIPPTFPPNLPAIQSP